MESEIQKQKQSQQQQPSGIVKQNTILSASNVSQRSNRSRKGAKIKSQGARNRESFTGQAVGGNQQQQKNASRTNVASQQREASCNEYNKTGGISNASQQNARSVRAATSECSARQLNRGSQQHLQQKSGVLGDNGVLFTEENRKQSCTSVVADEESKQPASKMTMQANTLTNHKKDSLQSGKVVTKKKKSRIGNNNTSAVTNSSLGGEHPIPSASSKQTAKKSSKQVKQSSEFSVKNHRGGDEIADNNNSSGESRKGISKLGSAGSAGAAKHGATKSENSRVATSIGELQLSQQQGANLTKVVLPSNDAQMKMQSSIKNRLSGREIEAKTVSNWDQSRRSQESEQQKMMATTGALSPRNSDQIKVSKLEKEEDGHSSREEKGKAEAIRAQNCSAIEGSGRLQLQQSTDQQSAANQPASPASRAPMKASELRPTPLDLSNQSIVVEADNESPISPPVSAGPIIRDSINQEGGSTFGIKLQKVPQPKESEVVSTDKPITELANSTKKSVLDISNTHGSFAEASANHSQAAAAEGEDCDVSRPTLTEPLPILPKVTTVIHMPVKCPIENVRFIQLKRFLQMQRQQAEMMTAGFDLVGQRRKMIQMKTEDKIRKGTTGIDDQQILAKIDDTTHFIKSIVFARDPKIIDQEKGHVHQRDAFSHLNNLDVKMLVDRNKYLGEESKYSSLSPRGVNRIRIAQARQPIYDCQIYKLKDQEDRTLLFESRFESGNLYLAQKVSEQEYNLLMQNDINTQGHTQWFFFQVKNTRANSKVRFNILNYSKPDSLFNYGMKLSVYSDKKSDKKNMGWHKDCEDIRYYINGIRKDVTYYSKSYYTLTFTYTFEYDDDIVYFAYSIPYTYTDLRNDITAIEQDPARSKLVRKSTLCRTLSGELCEVLTITSADNLENFRNRRGVVLTARVHPGETVGSWMMRGCLTFLTDPENHEAKLLRDNFVFKVVPMLNPDGVINGNYRCSLAGCDLNRRWKTPNKTLHPTIFHCKRLVKQIHQERGLVLYCDLHGHSRKQNVFMYGCNNKQNPGECRIFPFILGKMNKYFCYDYSRFGVQKSKEATARVALYKELKNVPNIFTMESSFAGVDFGPAAGQHLTSEMLETLGHDCCRAILIYCNMYVPPELANQPFFKNILQQQAAKKANASSLDKKKFKEPALDLKTALNNEINGNAELLTNTGGDDSSSGSDSAPSEDNMQAEELIKQLPTADKTLKLQLKKNEQKRKKEEEEKEKVAQSSVKLRRQSSGRNLKKEEPPPKRQMSPLKRPAPPQEKVKEEPKPEEKKKPKVETRDAQTQTDRSDYQLIKQKMLRERRLKEEQAAQQLAQKRTQGTGQPSEAINDIGGRPQDYVSKQQTVQLNTSQRLQQMMGMSEPKSRSGNTKMQIQQPYPHQHQKPLKHLTPSSQQPIQQVRNPVSNQTSKTQRNDVLGAQHTPISSSGNNQPLTIPDKNKYNFMGVSTIKQGQLQNGQQPGQGNFISQPQTATNENEYVASGGSMLKPPNGVSSPNKNEQLQDSKNLYHSQGLNREKIPENIQKDALNKVDSRRSGNRVVSGGIGELPAMTTLSGNNNTNNSFRDPQQQPQQYLNSSSGAASRMHHKHSGSYQLGTASTRNNPQNYETEPNNAQVPGIFSPQAVPNQNNSGGLKAQFILPQTKQLPQKEFVMMDVGQATKTNNNRKTSRNPNPKNYSNHTSIAGVTNTNYGQNKYTTQQNYQGIAQGGGSNQMNRFSQQRTVANINSATEQTLARNNSTHCAVAGGKYAAPLGSSPMTKVQNHIQVQPAVSSSPTDTQQQYAMQLSDMSHSQSVVTRNGGGVNQTLGVSGGGVIAGSLKAPASSSKSGGVGQGQQPLRASYNVQRTPQSKQGNWQNAQSNHNHQMLMMESNNATSGHQYRAMGNSLLPQGQVPGDHDNNKLPALNIRGPASKTTRAGGPNQQNQNQTNSHQNASGVIGGLQIVLNNGQALSTPQQKMQFQIGQSTKFQNQSQLVSPSVQHMSAARAGSGAQGKSRSHLQVANSDVFDTE